jgi:hypothetical protein
MRDQTLNMYSYTDNNMADFGYTCPSCGMNVTGWQVRAAADFDGNCTPDLVINTRVRPGER